MNWVGSGRVVLHGRVQGLRGYGLSGGSLQCVGVGVGVGVGHDFRCSWWGGALPMAGSMARVGKGVRGAT